MTLASKFSAGIWAKVQQRVSILKTNRMQLQTNSRLEVSWCCMCSLDLLPLVQPAVSPQVQQLNVWLCVQVPPAFGYVPSVDGRHVLTLRCSSLHSSVDKVLPSLVRAFTAEHPDELECLQLVLYLFFSSSTRVTKHPLIPFKILDTGSELLSTTACDKVWMSPFLYIIDVWASIIATVAFLREWRIDQSEPSGCCGRLEGPQFHAGNDEDFNKGTCDDMVQ